VPGALKVPPRAFVARPAAEARLQPRWSERGERDVSGSRAARSTRGIAMT